ncbi:hypothetical protein L9F63_008295, partial [Diploptera punctata]
SSCETDDSEQFAPEYPAGCSNIKQEPRSPGLFKPCPYPGPTGTHYGHYSSYGSSTGFPTPCLRSGAGSYSHVSVKKEPSDRGYEPEQHRVSLVTVGRYQDLSSASNLIVHRTINIR